MIWALVPVGTRFFVQRIDPYLFNSVRFLAAGCAALPLFLHARPWRWPPPDIALLAVCAVLAIPGYHIPVALGARTLTAGELGVLIATEPVMIAALTLLMTRRGFNRRLAGGSLTALVGVCVTSGVLDSTQKFEPIGTLEVLAGALSWSCYTVLTGRLTQRYGSFAVTGAIVVLGAIVLLAASLPMVTSPMLPDRMTLLLLASMGIASSLGGFVLWNYAAAIVPAERLGLYLYMIPIVSIYGGVQFLAEPINLKILLGAALTVFGVWIACREPMTRVVPLID